MIFIPMKGVLKRYPYTRQHIARLEKAGKFPKRVRLGPGRVAWVDEELDAHDQALIDARDNAGKAA